MAGAGAGVDIMAILIMGMAIPIMVMVMGILIMDTDIPVTVMDIPVTVMDMVVTMGIINTVTIEAEEDITTIMEL